MLRFLSVLLVLFYSAADRPTSAQTPEKVIYVVHKGDDSVVHLPKGLEYQAVESRYIKAKPKVEVQPNGSLLIRGRIPVLTEEAGQKVSLRLAGTKVLTLEIGIPDGYYAKFGPPPVPEKKEDKKLE